MKHIPAVTDELAALKPAVLEKPGSRPDVPDWLQRVRQSRFGGLLSSFPSQVFFLSLAFYVALTCLHLWLNGVPGSQQAAPGALPLADWGTGFTAAWARFDSYFFLHIAQYGYTDQGLGAFFPLYPLLIRLLAWPLAGHFTLAALLVSWLCAWGSFLCFFRLAQRECGPRVARWALLFLALCPVSFFSFAPYSESLFLLVSLGAIERARAGHLWQASLLAALGMLTRPTGILLLIPLAWEWGRRSQRVTRLVSRLKQAGAHHTPPLSPPGTAAVHAENPPVPPASVLARAGGMPRFAWLSLGLIPLALLGYMLYLKLRTGNALAFLAGESAWHRHLALPWETVGFFGIAFQQAWQAGDAIVLIGNTVDLLLVLVVPALVLYSAIHHKSLWLGAALYQLALTLMLIAVPNAPGPYGEEVLLSTQRFMLPAFPVFLLLGQFSGKHPWVARLLLIAGAVLLLLNTWRFLNNVFIA
jgi:hypothetical protein